jgi:PhnB protein
VPKNPPDGYHSVTPYAVVPDATTLIDFATSVLGGTLKERMDRDDGSVMHAEVTVGDSLLMLSSTDEENPPFPAMLHVYVDDVDAVYEAALARGATSLRKPDDQFYGDRVGGVVDTQGNQWWLATRVEDVSPEEMERRLTAMT